MPKALKKLVFIYLRGSSILRSHVKLPLHYSNAGINLFTETIYSVDGSLLAVQINQFQRLEQEITKPVENDISKWKPPLDLAAANSTAASQDRQLLFFYSDQCETHFISLLNAIDAFFNCISTTQPPRIFVAHSKFVILSAHKLIFIGDTLTRQVTTQEIRSKVMNSSNQLCELLKSVVMATKMAALHYPNTAALQEMVDRVTELSHHAQLFKRSLVQMASL